MEKILATSSGRYKVLKLVQYISKLILLLGHHKRIYLGVEYRERLRALVGQCSLQRRVLQLGNLYKPLKGLLTNKSPGKYHWTTLMGLLTTLVEDTSEDVFTLTQLGWLPHRFAHWAIYADRAWLISLLIDLRAWSTEKQALMRRKALYRSIDQRPKVEEVTRSKQASLREEEWWLDLDGLKTMCDAGQAWCDVFEVQVFDGFVVGCALTSSVLGLYKFVAKP